MSNIVTLPYDPTWKALEWAKRNLGGSYITNALHREDRMPVQLIRESDIDYFFSDPQSALIFTLKFK